LHGVPLRILEMNTWTGVTGDWKVAEPAGWKACATCSVDILVRKLRGLSSPQFKNSVEPCRVAPVYRAITPRHPAG